jgi:hypothetical protein
MPTKAAEEREISALAGRMLSVLEDHHRQGSDAYPPTLRRLAELCDVDGADPRVLKAAAKKVFSGKAVVPKQGKQIDLEAQVRLKDDPEAATARGSQPAKPKRVDEIAALAERMLGVLAAQRPHDGDAGSPTLRQLAELCDIDGSDPRVLKAAGKKVLTDKAVVPKRDRRPDLDAPVRLKEDLPTLVARILGVLESQRRLGGGAYPVSLRRLALLCGLNASDKRVNAAAAHRTFTERAIIARQENRKPVMGAPVILRDDIQDGVATVALSLLRFTLSDEAKPKNRKQAKPPETTAFPVDELTKRLAKEIQEPFQVAVTRGIEQETLPLDFAWVVIDGKPHLFAVDQMRPEALRRSFSNSGQETSPFSRRDEPSTAPRPPATPLPAADHGPPSSDFAEAFRAAFDRIDRENGAMNFVKLTDLRRALPGFTREQFDAGLKRLRLDRQFSLDSHEGRYETLRPDDRDAGIHEAGSLLIYASRR